MSRYIDADASAYLVASNGDADFINKVTKLMIEAPSIDIEPKQGEWIDKAISIIDEMEIEGIIAYEQAWEFRMRARMKGADDE